MIMMHYAMESTILLNECYKFRLRVSLAKMLIRRDLMDCKFAHISDTHLGCSHLGQESAQRMYQCILAGKIFPEKRLFVVFAGRQDFKLQRFQMNSNHRHAYTALVTSRPLSNSSIFYSHPAICPIVLL